LQIIAEALVTVGAPAGQHSVVCDVFPEQTPAIVHREDAKARVLRAENGEIRKRLDTLAMDRVLRNSDKGNLDLALSEMELGLFSAENRLTTRCHQGNAGLPCKPPSAICGDITLVWHS
jgi:hypothetical protein